MKLSRRLFLGSAAGLACGVGSAGAVQRPRPLVFGVGGQSNSSGRNEGVTPPGFPDPLVADRITNFTNAWTWQTPAQEPLDNSAGQLDGVSRDESPSLGSTAGVGHGLAFAERLAQSVPNQIILVPFAAGGTRIDQWLPEPYLRRDRLYGSALWRLLYAARHGDLAGLLWYQGEADTIYPQYANNFRSRTQQVFDAFRRDTAEPDLPIIYAQLHPSNPSSTRVYWDFIRSEQEALQQSSPPQIMTEALGSRYDSIHLSVESQIDLGHRMAERYLTDVLGVAV